MATTITNQSLNSALLGNGKSNDTESVTKATSAKTKTEEVTKTSNNAYLLDLSPAAQKLLKQNQAAKDYGYTLYPNEMNKVAKVLAEFQNTDMTVDNLKKIDSALKQAGVSSDSLSGKDLSRSFNSTSTLLDALSGKSTMISAKERLGNQSDKTTKFYDQIVADWKLLKSKEANSKDLPNNLSELVKASKEA